MKTTTFFKSLFSKEHRSHYDKVFWLMMIALAIVSAVTMYSAGSQLVYRSLANNSSHFAPVFSHIVFLVAGLGVAWLVQQFPSNIIRGIAYVILAFSIVFLLLMFVPGFGVRVNGATRWLDLGFVTFQPSEFAKLSLIIVVSDLLSRMNDKEPELRRKYFLYALGLTILVCGLIMINNLSTAVMLGAIIFIMMFLARVDWKVLVGMIAIAVVFLLSGYLIVKNVYIDQHRALPRPLARAETWVNRIDNMNADNEITAITDQNRQIVCSQIAIARGAKTPIGVGPGQSKERDFLPLAYADFIFAIYVEETGIVGAIILILIYVTILFRACSSSSRFGDHGAMLMVMGLGLLISLQAFISMAVTVGIGPVTGQPLPMMTRGGTGIILTSVYFGIMMAVSREQNELKAQEQKTLDESQHSDAELV